MLLKAGELESPLGGVGHPQMPVLSDRDGDPDSGQRALDNLAVEVPEDGYESEGPGLRPGLCTAPAVVARWPSLPHQVAVLS